ncbi:hypothetical protein HanIR_Chr03g0125881 [Helianthus annuus]|nr:hypothetical protein HanIR_Chr03g0125881 [Helianthus annuus]
MIVREESPAGLRGFLFSSFALFQIIITLTSPQTYYNLNSISKTFKSVAPKLSCRTYNSSFSFV